ncbi:MAG: NfeD family protein, partial [bacterium]
AITDPNIAMILMSLGAAGLFIELYNPGLILPGVVGAVSLVLAFYSFQTLAANYAGILLMLLGLLFFVAEIKVVSYGLLAVSGIISIFLGALKLFNQPQTKGLSISWSILGVSLSALLLIMLSLIWIVIKAQRRKIETGAEALVGKTGRVKTALSPSGKVFVEGELWDAVSPGGEMAEGTRVSVEAVDGFTLKVRRIA